MLQGFCYVYYSHADAAAAAMDHLNGMEFPPNTGHRLKVNFTQPCHHRIQIYIQSCLLEAAQVSPAESVALVLQQKT